MSTEKIIGGIFFALFTLATCLLLLPRFRKYARWRDSGAPMSLRSRIIVPLFPACCGLAAVTGSALWVIPGLAVWLFGFFSFRADRRQYLKEKGHVA